MYRAFVTAVFMMGLVGRLHAQSPPALVDEYPLTISPQAIEAFQRFRVDKMPHRYAPNKGETWQTFRKKYDQYAVDVNRATMERYARRAITKREFGGVDVYIAVPKHLDTNLKGKILLYIHGGGFLFLSASNTFNECLPLANEMGLPVYSIEYPLAPEHPFPAGVNACADAYAALANEFGAQNICVSGVSAGGGLVVSTMLEANDRGLPMPAAIASLTPWCDLTMKGDSYYTLDGYDPILYRSGLVPMAKAYAGKQSLDNPLVSPVLAEFPDGFPPTIIYTGTRDLMLSNCARLHLAMVRDGVDAHLRVWDGLWHGFQLTEELPESTEAIEDQARFFRSHLGLVPRTGE